MEYRRTSQEKWGWGRLFLSRILNGLYVNILVVHQSFIIPTSRTGDPRKMNVCFIHMSSGVTFVFWTELECGQDKVYSTAPDKVMDEALVLIHSAIDLYRYIKDILWYWTVKALYFHFEWASVAWTYLLAFISLSASMCRDMIHYREWLLLMSGNLSDYLRDYCLFSTVAEPKMSGNYTDNNLLTTAGRQGSIQEQLRAKLPCLVVNVTLQSTSFKNS